jgi:hypothetical protein
MGEELQSRWFSTRVALQSRHGKLAPAHQRRSGHLPRQSLHPRIMVSVIIDNIAAHVSREEILRSYPELTAPDINAALSYAAELTREGSVRLPLETSA